ncbi:20257_t:CDS:1, partial [Gigaspora rosea]
MITIQDCIELTEKYIFEKRIDCYDRSEFSDPEKIADGVCKLKWRNCGIAVALKSIKIPKEACLNII